MAGTKCAGLKAACSTSANRLSALPFNNSATSQRDATSPWFIELITIYRREESSHLL
jgi:hypothetical protein